MQVRELMTENPATCTPDLNLQKVAQLMVQHDCGAVPVVDSPDSRKPLGMVTDRDVMTRLVAQGENPLQRRATDAMTDAVVAVEAEDSAERAAELMEENQVRRLMVTEDGESCVGIVAQADLARHISEDTTGEVVEEVSEPSQNAAQPST